MDEEKRVQISVRLPESFAREFRALCVLDRITIQEVLEQAARKFVEQGKRRYFFVDTVFQDKNDGKWYYGSIGHRRGPFNTPQEAQEAEMTEEAEIDNSPSL